MKPINHLIVSVGRNVNKKLIEAHVNSISIQTKDFDKNRNMIIHGVMVDSDFDTAERVKNVFAEKQPGYLYHARLSSERNYALKNICNVIRFMEEVIHDHDVVSVVDLDDRLEKKALKRIHDLYTKNNGLGLTYGSYRPLSGKRKRNCGQYPKGCDFRKHRWLGSHLLTFRYGLMRNLLEDNLNSMLLAGQRWPKYAYDFAFTFSLMELAGHDRIKHVPDVLYVYNDMSPHNCHKIARKAQIAEANWYRAQEPLKRLEVVPW